MHNFDFAAVISGGGTGQKVINNDMSNGMGIIGDASLTGAQNAAAVMCYDCNNMTIAHNYVHDMNSLGFSVSHSSGTTNNLVFDSNVLYNTCKSIRDCGAIYTQDLAHTSTGQVMVNNYIKDGCTFSGCAPGSGGWGSGIYLDDCASNWVVKGNVLTGNNGNNTIMYHGGFNLAVSNNLTDLDNFGNSIARFQNSGNCSPSSNTYQNNIVVSNGSVPGYNGFSGNVAIANNDYFNYDGGTLTNTGDTSPAAVDPSLNCYNYYLATGSAAKNSPTLFKDLYRGWGPPGFVINQTFPGTVPSSPHGC